MSVPDVAWAGALLVIARAGGGKASSFWIVPVPIPFPIVALVAPDRVTVKVSSSSNAVSAHTSTVMSLEVSPGAKESVVLLWLRSEERRVGQAAQLACPIAVSLPEA